jgi:serine/threonine protein kinase
MAWVGPHDDPDRYQLRVKRSSGGEGELWGATIAVDGAPIPVAVKVIHPSKAGDLSEWRTRWQRQAELLRSLDHPGLVKVREVFEGPTPHEAAASDRSTNTLYLVMNWVEGPTLDEWVSRHPGRDVLACAGVIGKLASAVDYLHSGAVTGNPILHRDIKPANVIVADRGAVLVDFGFTRVLNHQPLTLAGTPAYIAPEVVAGGEYSTASDRYALGATAYFALTGNPPTPSDRAHMVSALTAVAGAEGRGDIAEHVLSMMDPNPAARPTAAVSWAQQLAAAAVSDTEHTVAGRKLPPPPPPPPQAGTAHGPWSPPPTSEPPPSSEPPPVGKPRRRRRRALVAGVAVVVALLAVGGAALFALGSGEEDAPAAAAAPTSRAQTTAPLATTAETATPASGAPPTTPAEVTTTLALVRVPRVVGGSVEAATAALEDLGLVVTVEEEVGPGPYGAVTDVDPRVGTELAPGDEVVVTVKVRPTEMPSVVGEPERAAVELLESYGIAATVTDVLDETARNGTVTKQTPAAGEPLTDTAELVVAHQPEIVFLADMDPVDVDGDEATGQAQLNGTIYTRSVLLRPPGADPGYLEYDLARAFTRLVGTVGPRDDVLSDGVYKVEIFADGTSVFDQRLGLGQTAPIDLDVTNVLRLRLQVTQIAGAFRGPRVVVFADTRLLGLPGSVPATTSP